MVALDHRSVAKTRFDNVRVDSTLNKIIYLADLLCFFLEYTNEFLTDYLALALGFFNSRKLAKESLTCIYADKIHAAVCKCCFNLVALILAHKSVVNENTGKLAADCLCKQLAGYGAVNTARKRQQSLAVAYLFADIADSCFGIAFHSPVTLAATNFCEEVAQHFKALNGVVYLGVELNAVQLSFLVCHCAVGAFYAVTD